MRFIFAASKERAWIWTNVVAPFAITRLALLLVGWFSQYFPASLNYPPEEVARRGWQFSPHRLLDIWGRWDTAWYLSIVSDGYSIRGDVETTLSNIAFFPFYPYLVKLLFFLVPAAWRTTETLLLVGVVVSNAFLLGALILLYRLVVATFEDEGIARRAVWYLLLFPTGFFFSCFYSEAAFLFLSVAAFYAASKRAWGAAGLLGGLLALTRPHGVLITIPLVWIYLESLDWQLRRIRTDVAWFALVPIGLGEFLLYAYNLSGNFLAPFQQQAAWQKELMPPWETILNPNLALSYVTPVDRVLVVVVVALGIVALFRLPSASYGIFSILLVLPPLLQGTLMSVGRYSAVVFPTFIVLALLGKNQTIDRLITVTALTMQILLMAAWTQFYWVG